MVYVIVAYGLVWYGMVYGMDWYGIVVYDMVGMFW